MRLKEMLLSGELRAHREYIINKRKGVWAVALKENVDKAKLSGLWDEVQPKNIPGWD